MVEARVGGPMLVLLSRCLVRATSSALAAHSAPVGGVAYVPARCLFNGAACQAGAFSHRHDSSRPHHARRPISTTSPLSAATAVSTADTPSSSSTSPSPSSALKHGAGKSGGGVSGDPRVAKVFDDIKKPARDDRAYRMVWLRNGMQVLLASDPTTDMASASMNIHAGHFQDPPELPGLAHFHEHMLFLGTDKFAKEGEYEAFLNSHGGSSNAYTAMEDTNYYFSVKWDQLRGALERFSAFYTCPRFDDSATEREMNAVDSEHTNNRQDDGWRLYQLQKSLAHPDHPFHKFGSGNLETLKPRPEEGIDTRQELLKFHETYYSADIMKLAVIGREPLDVLQSWVVDLFSDVRTTGQPSHYTYPVQAFGPSSLGIRLQVVPVRDTRRLSLAFPLPFNWEDQQAMQPSKPSRYISHLVGHEGPGSLYSLLNGKGWIESLSAGASMRTSDMEIFKVSVSLTPEGIKHIDEVTGLVFQFFKLLRDSPVRADLFDELKTMSEIKFLFREKENAVDFASTASSLMQDYDAPSILWGPYQLQLNEADIRKYLSLITPQHMQMTIVSKHLQEQAAAEPETWRAEKWYGTLHKLERIDEGLLKQWADPPSLDPGLSLPNANPFMPHDFTIKSDLPPYRDLPADDPVDPEAPVIIQSAPGVTVYHKLDRMFKVPKALFFAHLRSRHVYASPHSVIMQRLYSMVLREELNDFAYDAALAGLSYSVSARTTGLGIKVAGYSHKLPVLLDRVLQRSQSLVHDLKEKGDTDQELLRKFEKHRDKLIREYTNFMEREAPYELALYHTRQALDAVCWHVGQYLSVLRAPECRPSVMASTVATNLKRMDLDAFAHGNLEEKDAAHLTGELTSALGFGPLFDGEEPDERTIELPAGSTVVFQADGPNPEEDNSAAEVHFQVGHMHAGSIEEDMLVDVINHLAHTSAYQTLRTEKQLGYIVSTFSRRLNGVQGFSVVVQSPSASPTALGGHIEEWMVRFRGEMERMTPEEFQGHINAIEAQKMEKDKRLSEESHRHWSEIVERRFEFHRSVDEVEALKKLTLQKLINFWDSRLAAGAPERRKFASYVYSPKHAGEKLKSNWEVTPTSSSLTSASPPAAAAAGGEGDSNVIVIDTIDALRAYKRTRPLYPSVGR